MWLGLDKWKQAGLYSPDSPSTSAINITFATGLPVMFGVPKYSTKLNELREARVVEGLFQHDLLSIDSNIATFAQPDGGGKVKRHFDFLHAVPKINNGDPGEVKHAEQVHLDNFVGFWLLNGFDRQFGIKPIPSLDDSRTSNGMIDTSMFFEGSLEQLDVVRVLRNVDLDKRWYI